MEFYHNQLKIRLLNEKDINVYQRADWLVDKLGTKVHSYFWLDEYSGKDDFARYWKNEWVSGLTSWRKALKIPDTNVLMDDGCAKVTDQHDQDKAYIVWNPSSMLSICDCCWAKDGNLCEHILKVLSICRSRASVQPSISLFQYHQALNSMLHCPPFDSLIRDHAVSLAVSVQKQLNTLLNKESVQTAVYPIEKRIVFDIHQESSRVVSAAQDQTLVCKRHVANGILSRDADGCAAHAMSDIPGQVVDHGCTRNDKPFEIAGEDNLHTHMDVDPSSICVPSTGLCSVVETVSCHDAFPEKQNMSLTTGNEISASKNGTLSEDINEDICKDYVMDVDPHL